MKLRIPLAAGVPVVFVILAASACSSASTTATSTPAIAAPAMHPKGGQPPVAKSGQSAQTACAKRKPGAQIYVRDAQPGTRATAQELGGRWQWVDGQCASAVEWAVATAGTASGECTTIGYVSDNPGYDFNAVPAPRLKDVTAEAGPGCG